MGHRCFTVNNSRREKARSLHSKLWSTDKRKQMGKLIPLTNKVTITKLLISQLNLKTCLHRQLSALRSVVCNKSERRHGQPHKKLLCWLPAALERFGRFLAMTQMSLTAPPLSCGQLSSKPTDQKAPTQSQFSLQRICRKYKWIWCKQT